MYDNCLYFSAKAENDSLILKTLGLEPGSFMLATIHREHNTEQAATLSGIFDAFKEIAASAKMPVIIPLHPRTFKVLNRTYKDSSKWLQSTGSNVRIIEPVSYFEMLVLEKNCSMVFTDSGGVQKEAYFFRKPCIIVRDETEWTEIVDTGSAIVAGTAAEGIISAWSRFSIAPPVQFPPVFGHGNAAQFICEKIYQLIDRKG
jgi:UDP-GlcNAc3NAcA epimerase